MIIKSVTVSNFRGYLNKKTFDFDSVPFIMLIAPNGNGKSSLIDAIEWCLTGDIKHIKETFERRNTTKTEKIENQNAILKNKNNPDGSVRVCVTIDNNDEKYVIERIQSDDTLENGGCVSINEKSKEESTKILKELFDTKNFYKYHFCSMQKTYNFLNIDKGQMREEFSDFSADYSAEENVIENLNFFQEDLKKRKELIKKDLIPDSTIQEWNNQVNRYQTSPEIIPYDVVKVFEDELVDITALDEKQLNEQLEMLYKCSYNHVRDLLQVKLKNSDIMKCKTQIEELKKEYIEHKVEITEAIQIKAYKEEIRVQSENELKKYKDLKLTNENLEGIKEELFKMKEEKFTEDYWNKSKLIRERLHNEYVDLGEEIKILSKGNEILELFSTIIVSKEQIIGYRKERHLQNPDGKILCPICGSEQFDNIEDDMLTTQAYFYQKKQLELIEKKKRLYNEIIKKEKVILTEQLNFAEQDLKKHIEKIQKRFDNIIKIYNSTKKYFATFEDLNNQKPDVYSFEKIGNIDYIDSLILENEKQLLSWSNLKKLNMEIHNVLKFLNYSIDENCSDESLLKDLELRSMQGPKVLSYDDERIKNKIFSLRSYIGNTEYLDVNQKLQNGQKKNEQVIKEIEDLSKLEKEARDQASKIKSSIEDLKKQEYAQVGPFLYSIYYKLSRNSSVYGIKLENTNKGRILLTDEGNNALLNIFSDGQLSVFMVSYFLGNIFRLRKREKLPVYFIDDITCCMDDINMLAFLDLIKYQLLDKEGAIHQIIFATCDERMEQLLTYKMESAGIQYKKIGMNEFLK